MFSSTPRRPAGQRRLAVALLFLAVSLWAAAPGAAVPYRLGIMDKLRVRVVEWQTAEGSFRSWDAINGDYKVGQSGTLLLPFVGEMPAIGKTTSEIAAAISEALQQKFGLIDRPDASVEVVQFRPIFVAGDVRAPGSFEYGPDLTVLKAVSLAGGMRRAIDEYESAERNYISAEGNWAVAVAERNRLYARRARLTAEAEGRTDAALPQELADVEEADAMMADEQSVMTARDKRMRLQLQQIEDLKTLLRNEIASLEKKSATQTRQVELAREELQGIGKLADRGLVVNSRVLSIEQRIADIEGKVLDLDTAALRAKQDINKASQDATNLANDRSREIAEARQQAEKDIVELSLKIDTYRSLMAEALAKAPDIAARAADGSAPAVTYSIVRGGGSETQEIPADENTPILPGDVVKVTLPLMPSTN